jgi:hypothetical protein
MTALVSYILTYLLGGLTFIPLIVLAILYHAHITQPVVDPESFHKRDVLELSTSEEDAAVNELENLPIEISHRVHEPDVAAGYFIICREYTPSVMAGKPTEKAPSSTSAAPGSSPSVYQSMYRSIFERGKTQSPSLDGGQKGNKKVRNTFFVVIRSVYSSRHYIGKLTIIS